MYYNSNKMASFVYKCAILLVCIVALLFALGIFNGTFAVFKLLYYPVANLLFSFVFYIVNTIVVGISLRKSGKKGVVRFAPHFKGALVMSNILAIVVFFIVLSDPVMQSNLFSPVANVLMYIIVPLMVIADWAIFNRKRRFFASDPIMWVVVPLMYYGILLIAAQLGVLYYDGYAYPYTFIDPDRVAWAPVLVNIFIVGMVYFVSGYLLFSVDRFLGERAKKKVEDKANIFKQANFGLATANGNAAPPAKPHRDVDEDEMVVATSMDMMMNIPLPPPTGQSRPEPKPYVYHAAAKPAETMRPNPPPTARKTAVVARPATPPQQAPRQQPQPQRPNSADGQ